MKKHEELLKELRKNTAFHAKSSKAMITQIKRYGFLGSVEVTSSILVSSFT